MRDFERMNQELKRYLPEYIRDTRGIDVCDGKNIKCLNPEHDDTTPSMTYYSKDNKLYCHACNTTYDIIDLITMDRGITAAEACKWGCEHFGISDISAQTPMERKETIKERESMTTKTENPKAIQDAKSNYDAGTVCPSSHGYLQRKEVKADKAIRRSKRGDIMVPLYDVDGVFQSIQYIDKDGNKRFGKNCPKRGMFFPFGGEEAFSVIKDTYEPVPFYVCEGYATGASIVNVMTAGGKQLNKDYVLIAAMDAGNIPVVVEALNAKEYSAGFHIMADDDSNKGGNAGEKAARAAAEAVKSVSRYVEIYMHLPPFGKLDTDSEEATDWNDYTNLAVKSGATLDSVYEDMKQAAKHYAPLEAKQADSNAKESGRRFIKSLADAVKSLPKASYLVEDWICSRDVVLLYAESGVGKSFLGLDIALSVADPTITEWRGKKIKSGPVFYLCGEGYDDLVRRAVAWQQQKTNTPLTDIPIYISEHGLPITENSEAYEFLVNEVEALELNTTPKLIVIDTLNRHFCGSENAAEDAGAFLNAIISLKTRYNCAVIVVHHAGKDRTRGARGSSALFAGFDTVIRLEPVDGGATVKTEKGKSGLFFSFTFDFLRVPIEGHDDEYGKPMYSMVCVDEGQGNMQGMMTRGTSETNTATTAVKKPRQTAAERHGDVILQEIRKLNTAEHRASKTGEVRGALAEEITGEVYKRLSKQQYRDGKNYLLNTGLVIERHSRYIVAEYDRQTTIESE